MSYKGYLGSVAFSEKDGVFFGKIEIGQFRGRKCERIDRSLP